MAPYRWTAVALCLAAIAGGGLLAVADAEAVRMIVGLGVTLVLWATVGLIPLDPFSN